MKKGTKLFLTSEFASRKKIEFYERLFTSLPDPDKILQLNGNNFNVYRDLLNDPHLTAVIQQRKMQVLQMGWELDNIYDDTLKNELLNIIGSLNLNKIGADILDALLFGFVACEINWKFDKPSDKSSISNNTKLLPVDIVAKPQEWFVFDRNNELKYMPKGRFSYADEGESLPDYKFIVIQYNPSYENPYGERLLRKVYWPVTFKRAGIEKWHLLSEKFGIPFLLGFYNDAATEDDKRNLLTEIEEAIENNIALMKTGTELEFKENPKYEIGQIFENMIEMQNKEISKAILTVTLTTEVEKTGSYKAAKVHKEMLEYIGLNDKKLVELAINKLIQFYIEVNYGNKKEMPRFRLKKKERIIETTVERDKTLSDMGVRFTEEYFEKRYNLGKGDFELSAK